MLRLLFFLVSLTDLALTLILISVVAEIMLPDLVYELSHYSDFREYHLLGLLVYLFMFCMLLLGITPIVVPLTSLGYILSWKSGGTLGMRLFKLRLRSRTGGEIRFVQLIAKFFFATIGVLLLCLPEWLALLFKGEQTLSTRVSGLVVVSTVKGGA